MPGRLAVVLCVLLASCAFTTKAPLRVVSDSDERVPWKVGAVYDTLNGDLAITADGAVVARGSFGLLDIRLRLEGAYKGYSITAACVKVRDTNVHYGPESAQCEVSVADRSAGGRMRIVRLGPGTDRDNIGSSEATRTASSVTQYDPSTGKIVAMIDGRLVAEGVFPPVSSEVQLNGTDQGRKVTVQCIKGPASGLSRDNVRCTVNEDETQVASQSVAATVAEQPASVPATIQPTAEEPAPALATIHPAAEKPAPAPATIQPVAEQPAPAPATGQPAPEQSAPAPATIQPAPEQPSSAPATVQTTPPKPTPEPATVRPCGGSPQCVHIEPQTYHLASNPDTSWLIAGDYDRLSSRLILTVNGSPVAEGRFGLLDLEIKIANKYEGHSISASCTKSHGASLASSALKCTVFVDRERAVVLQKET
jgi:hypothetical protein